MRLDHPATFATLAMDTDLKKMIVDDLDLFVRRREFYRKVGKAWKRGYLLYGPPGTGKSSLIAAMANYLNFDVYDLELAGISTNSDLRKLLINTANRSILVVEDIDCSLDEVEKRKDEERSLKMLKSSKTQTDTLNVEGKDKPNNQVRAIIDQPFHFCFEKQVWRPKCLCFFFVIDDQVTLSGLLNFVDGLWSSCGDERIIVFTTNHKDRLDGALLRPGRMDMHILMSYCTPCAFRTLAENYLGFEDHALFGEIDGLLGAAMATPAEVGEQLLRSEDADVALGGLIEFLQQKSREAGEHKGK